MLYSTRTARHPADRKCTTTTGIRVLYSTLLYCSVGPGLIDTGREICAMASLIRCLATSPRTSMRHGQTMGHCRPAGGPTIVRRGCPTRPERHPGVEADNEQSAPVLDCPQLRQASGRVSSHRLQEKLSIHCCRACKRRSVSPLVRQRSSFPAFQSERGRSAAEQATRKEDDGHLTSCYFTHFASLIARARGIVFTAALYVIMWAFVKTMWFNVLKVMWLMMVKTRSSSLSIDVSLGPNSSTDFWFRKRHTYDGLGVFSIPRMQST